MLIPVNQNIDEYKDDFYKGLTLRQSVISLITIAVGAAVYLTLTGVLHLPQSLALYLTLPVVFPIAAYGFLKIHGMNIAEYLRKSGAVKERSSYSFIPQMLLYGTEEDDQTVKVKTTGGSMAAGAAEYKADGKTRKAKILYLETEDSLRDLMEAHEEVMQIT
ncbi:PrgI family protein [Porcincola intestinalis]|uniref:PrgI family protein n=1 Tax=Porcincola intestinalis TaxID=2606632 RepID=A0A6L5X3S6_9FIRM|nr:PrgI family protein [Porcincola intestinalis]MSS14018.1 PrgI family protein [Porcincola intestinalis]